MIRFAGASKIFSNTQAGLSRIDAQFEAGSFTTLLGRSGSGKSTLLRLLGGLDQVSGGILDNPYEAQETGFVFQEPALIPWKSVRENIALPLELRKAPPTQIQEKVDQWMHKLKIKRFAEFYPHELSGGIKMRVSFARALVTEPKLLLLDEPFAALDEPIRIELGMELRSLWSTLKPTVILVTHSITEGLWLADQVIVLQGQPGQVVLNERLDLGVERPLELRARPEFTQKVQQCFDLLKGGGTL